jgi:uncharacterized protein DUF4333
VKLKPLSAFLALCAAVLAMVGCSASVSIGGKVLDKSEVEQGASDALAKVVGRAPDSITCPDDLDAKVGATERCTLTAGSHKLGMTVTVKSVEGDTANYEVKVDK